MTASVAGRRSLAVDLYPLVSQVVRATLGADSEQDDILQTALLRVVSNIGTVRDPSSLEGWVKAVAANTARQEIRIRQRRRRVFEQLPECPPWFGYEPDFDSGLRKDGARRILDRMPAREREVLSLWLAGAGTIAQIAHQLGCSLSTARRRLGRARRALTRATA